jgi:CRP-like cAMP-binding protein
VSTDYFSSFSDTIEFKAGETIFDAGDTGEVMYAVREGSAEIFVGERSVEVCEVGDFFGEMAIVDHSPRAARAVARTDVTLVPINQRRFLFLVHETPTFALQVMGRLAQRIRQMDQSLKDLP